MEVPQLSIQLEFSGGLELLLADAKQPKHRIDVKPGSLMRDLVKAVRKEVIKQRAELFATPEGEM